MIASISNGTLTISGTGDMYDFSYDYTPPWESYIDRFTHVVIEDGVTSIGDYAFYYEVIEDGVCDGLTSVSIGNSVTSIGSSAFSHCTGLTSIVIPNSVKRPGGNAFSGCSSLKQVMVEWIHPLPLYLRFDPFDRVNIANVKLLVPAGTADLYRAAPVWQDFMIEESTGITSVTVDDSPVLSTQYYELNGREVTNPQQGKIYIAKELHRSGQTTVRKIAVNGQW